MITIIGLVLFITVFHNGCSQKIGGCRSLTNMDANLRRVALEQHNWKRYFLAGGRPFPDNPHIIYPPAGDMSVLYYDCDLEVEAYEIAFECNNKDPDFNRLGSNSGISRSTNFTTDHVTEVVHEWWKTALKGRNLVNLTPTQENKPKIPFLQMANGRTNRVGCAYEWCYDDYEELNATPHALFVCKYGEEKVKIGQPIYHSGPPCSTCRNSCTFNNRLCKS